MTYRVYLRNADSLVTEKTMIGDPEAAIAAFTAPTERITTSAGRRRPRPAATPGNGGADAPHRLT